jgi:hypothetical protein
VEQCILKVLKKEEKVLPELITRPAESGEESPEDLELRRKITQQRLDFQEESAHAEAELEKLLSHMRAARD